MSIAGARARRLQSRTSARLRSFSLLLVVPLMLTSSTVAAAPDEDKWPSSPSEVFVGAGDISYCGLDGDDRTAALLDVIEGTVFTLGDNSQQEGTHQQFRECYGPSWGRHKARTRPAIGNHERLSGDAAGYFDYFGEAAGPWGRGYYSYEVGSWRIYALDSNCDLVGGCGVGSAQEQWLRAELAARPATCTLAIWHHPLFNSGDVGEHPETRDLWLALEEAGADIVLSGHDHHYERFARQDAQGRPSESGMRQFIVGTGGGIFHGYGSRAANSKVYQGNTLGLLKLDLRPNSYTWDFVAAPGSWFGDRGWDACR